MPLFDHTDKSTWISVDRKVPLVPIISPSILAADFATLRDDCVHVLSSEGGESEWLHFDVMDGHFVPNMSIGSCVAASLRKHLPHAFLDVHLMVSHPEQWVKDFAMAGSSQYTFHIEATENPEALIRMIRDAGMQVGVAIKPKTPASSIFSLLDKGLVDMALIMTVEPGFGGQSFMQDMMPKVTELRQKYPWLNIQVDGGLGEDTIEAAANAGANVIVAGTSIFKSKNRKDTVQLLRQTVKSHLS